MSGVNLDINKYDNDIECSAFFENSNDDYETMCEKFLCTLAALVDGRIRYCYNCDNGDSFVSDSDVCPECGHKVHTDVFFGLDAIAGYEDKIDSNELDKDYKDLPCDPIDGGYEVMCKMPMFDWGSNGIGIYVSVVSGNVEWDLWNGDVYVYDENGNSVYTYRLWRSVGELAEGERECPAWIDDLREKIEHEAIKYVKSWSSNIDKIISEFE